MKKTSRFILLVAASVVSLAASAQWQWLDADGKKVYSDRPPPDSVPEDRITKRPPPPVRKVITPEEIQARVDASAAGAEANGGEKAPAPNLVDEELQKKLEEQKTTEEREEEARRKAEEERIARVRAANCENAQQAKRTLESGMRVAQVNEKGERVVMDDKMRNAELERVNNSVRENCSPLPGK